MNEAIPRSGERLRKWAVAKPDFVVAALCLMLGFWGWFSRGPIWVAAMRPAKDDVIDFYQDWGSAKNHLVGLPVYTPHSTSIPRHLGLPSNPIPGIEYNAHPPTSVLLALPLARLDYPEAVLVWNTISLGAFLASLGIVVVVLPVPRPLFLPALALLPFCLPVLGNLELGQLNLFLVLLATMIWALERSGRSSTGGLILGAAAAIKLFPTYLAVYFLARGQIRPLLAATLSSLALTLVTALVLGLDTYHDYVSVVLPYQSKFQGLGYNLSIAGLWHKLFDPTAHVVLVPSLWPSSALARWGTYGSDLAITAIVATLAYRARTLAQRDLAFALAVTAMLLASPVTWDITLVLLLVPIAVLARSAGKSQWMPPALFLILLAVWLPQNVLAGLTLTECYFHTASWAFMLGVPSIKSYALLGTFALGLAAFRAEAAISGSEAVLEVASKPVRDLR
jgi:hypothetical protein